MIRRLALASIFALSGACAADHTSDELESARGLWNSANIDNYVYEIDSDIDGQRTVERVLVSPSSDSATINDLFDQITAASAEGADVSALYDSVLGYPTVVVIGRNSGTVDEIIVTNVQPIQFLDTVPTQFPSGRVPAPKPAPPRPHAPENWELQLDR